MTFVLFLYGDIQWSHGSYYYGIARIGFDSGTGIGYNLPQAINEDRILDLENLSNIGRPGIFAFRVDQESVILPSSK